MPGETLGTLRAKGAADMGKILKVIKREVIGILPATIFFLFFFHLLAFTRSLALAEYSIDADYTIVATIGALIIAKVIIVADNLPLINLFQKRPLVIDVLWRTLIYSIIALVIQYFEELIPQWIQTKHFIAANHHVIEEISWPQFWANHLWMVFGLMIYCTFSALIRAIGGDRVRELFLGSSNRRKT